MSVSSVSMPATHPLAGATIGRKAVMAVTGVILFGFVFVHMTGNLQVYMGPEPFNAYSEFLHHVLHGAGLWIARSVLLVSAVLHVWAATVLTLQSRRARPVGYRRWEAQESTYASRTMRWGGVLLLAFVIFHVLHLTTGTLHPDFIAGDPYANFVAGFEVWPVSVFYIVANLMLGLHLKHGVWSMLQTLGLSHPRYKRMAVAAAAGFALIITLGNISFPIAVLAGVVQ